MMLPFPALGESLWGNKEKMLWEDTVFLHKEIFQCITDILHCGIKLAEMMAGPFCNGGPVDSEL